MGRLAGAGPIFRYFSFGGKMEEGIKREMSNFFPAIMDKSNETIASLLEKLTQAEAGTKRKTS